jgi:hypothetical protein
MVKEVPGKTSEYGGTVRGGGEIEYPASDPSNRGAGKRILNSSVQAPANPPRPNDNKSGIRSSINDGPANVSGAVGAKVGPGAPNRHPVNGVNPKKPVKR